MKNIFSLTVTMLAIILFSSCNQDSKVSKEPELGKYIYLDFEYIIHSKNDCNYIATVKGGKPIEKVIPINELKNDYPICSQCITESMYEELKKIIESNK